MAFLLEEQIFIGEGFYEENNLCHFVSGSCSIIGI